MRNERETQKIVRRIIVLTCSLVSVLAMIYGVLYAVAWYGGLLVTQEQFKCIILILIGVVAGWVVTKLGDDAIS